MLLISNHQMLKIKNARLSALADRINAWLNESEVQTAPKLEAKRLQFVKETIVEGAAVGLRFETDYALFTRILLEHDEGWRDFLAEPEVRSILDSKVSRSEAKIRALHTKSFELLNSEQISKAHS